MPKITVQLSVTVEGKEPFSTTFEEAAKHEPTSEGIAGFVEEGKAALRAEVLYADYLDDLPHAEDLFPQRKKRSYRLEETSQMTVDGNKEEMWRYIGNTALAVKLNLAKARAFHELHKSIDPANEQSDISLLLAKLEKLNAAVHGIALLRGLHKSIIREAFGGEWFKVRQNNGQMRPARSLLEVLKHRQQFPEIDNLPPEVFAELEDVAKKLEDKASDVTKRFLKYREKLVHDAAEAIDDLRLFPQLQRDQLEPIIQEGKEVGEMRTVGGRPTKPNWEFDKIYALIASAYEHYLGTLRSLKKLDICGCP